MRTTITLDPGIHEQLEAYARERRTTFKEAINDVLRRGLAAPAADAADRFVVRPHRGAFVPGVDPGRLNQLLDELDVDDFIRKAT
jgi:hypothetical protein